MVHVLEEYKADSEDSRVGNLEADLAAANEVKQELEKRMMDMERRAAEIAKTNSSFLKQVNVMVII